MYVRFAWVHVTYIKLEDIFVQFSTFEKVCNFFFMVTHKFHYYVRTGFVNTYYAEIRSTNFYEICFESNTMVNQFLSVAFWVAITFHHPRSLPYVSFTLRTGTYFFWSAIFTFIFLWNETRINQIKNIVSFYELK